MKKASDLFVEALENEGVEYIFGVPGEENLDFLESLRKSKIKLILTRHEQGAGFMAATYGRLTGKTGVCLATLGPGATNFVTCAAYAQLGGMPICMITGQKPINKSKQGRFQIIDVVEMMKPLTKFTKQIVNGNTIPSIVRDAFRISQDERPGAIHLELPEDVAAEEVDAPIVPMHKTFIPNAGDMSISEAVEKIMNAKMPLILIGAGANRKRISQSLLKFVTDTGIPFFSTQMGKGVVDDSHEHNLGTAALSSGDYIHCAIDRADVIINIGHDVIEKPPFFMEHEGKEVIHINFFKAALDSIYFPQIEIIGDIATSIDKIGERTKKHPNWDFNYCYRIRDKIIKNIADSIKAVKPEDKPTPQTLVQVLQDIMPNDGIISLDNGVYKIWFARNYNAHQSNTLLLDNALASMGAGLPSAMMTALMYPEKKVVAVCGDGGFMMNSQEMETAVRLKLNMTVIVLRDNAYGMIKWKQHDAGFEDFGLDYGNPDFVKYAEAYGANGFRVNVLKELKPCLEKTINSKGVNLVEVNINYSENKVILVDEFRNIQCDIF
jgi:acetolactate synthase-1/2/3 large subunit